MTRLSEWKWSSLSTKDDVFMLLCCDVPSFPQDAASPAQGTQGYLHPKPITPVYPSMQSQDGASAEIDSIQVNSMLLENSTFSLLLLKT